MTINFKKYNIFNLFSTFSRGMVEIFIPLYLYKIGFKITDILFYFLIMLLISAVICIPLSYIGNKIKYKWLIFISATFFGLTYFILFNIVVNPIALCLLALCFSLYRRCYWIGKRYYELKIIPKHNMANNVSKVVIISQIATLSASYIGALLLNNISNFYILLISVFIFIFSVIPLMTIKEQKSDEKISIDNSILNQIPKKNIILMILYEFIYISSLVFPIYLYLYVNTNFEYIGLFSLFSGLSSMICIHLFSKKMDNDKCDYVFLSAFLLSITLLLKLNCTLTIVVLIIGLFEGIFSKIREVGHTRNIYFLGSHYNRASYNMLYEIIQNFSRLLAFLLILIFTRDLKVIIYICIAATFLSSFIRFDDGKDGYK
ncbi:MAG: hypothetical protein PHI22_01515 [Bacilli bacterium]|nr:hypothetical protein [Bacilli bacterium]